MDSLKAVKITWKEDEEWLCKYVWEHSSPSAWFKDLAIAEYKKKNNEEMIKPNPGVFNLLD